MQEAPDWSSLQFRGGRRWQPCWPDTGSDDLPRRWRLPLLAALVGLHALALWLVPLGRVFEAAPAADSLAIAVDFIDPPPEIALPTPARKTATGPGASRPLPARRPPPAASRRSRPVVSSAAEAHRPPAMALLFTDEGRVRLPDGLMDELDRRSGERRQFDFQVPGAARTHALMEHRRPLVYEATRFDSDWKPDQDLLSELLARAVEATTKEVRIPIPGDPRGTLVCKISLLAMGGGCGIDHAGANYLPPGDDPATLSAAEVRECQAWWEKIVAAKSQEIWLQTRALYDAQCRKPLLREKSMPRREAEAG